MAFRGLLGGESVVRRRMMVSAMANEMGASDASGKDQEWGTSGVSDWFITTPQVSLMC